MKKISLSFDDTLIISRLQQKELGQKHLGRALQKLSPLEKLSFNPIADNLPIKIGLNLNILGTKIVQAHVDRGYYFQNIEDRLASSSFQSSLDLLALLSAHAPIFYQLAFIHAWEELCKKLPPEDEIQRRLFAQSFARVYHHVHVISHMLACLELDSLGDLARVIVNMMKPLALIFARVHNKEKAFLLPSCDELANLLEALENIIIELEHALSFEKNLRLFLRKKAIITLNLAASFGLTGIYLRANRSPYELSSMPSNRPMLELCEGGDAWARFLLRIREMKSCTQWLKNNLDQHRGPVIIHDTFLASHALQPFAFGEIAGPEGDIKMSIFLDNNKRPSFYLRSPAYFIAQALPHLLMQADLSDLPCLLYSLGISAEEIDK